MTAQTLRLRDEQIQASTLLLCSGPLPLYGPRTALQHGLCQWASDALLEEILEMAGNVSDLTGKCGKMYYVRSGASNTTPDGALSPEGGPLAQH